MTESENELCSYIQPSDLTSHMYVRIYATYLYLYLPLPETGYMAPINLGVSQKEATRLVAPLAAGIPALSP